jgi:hypothetical protein
MRIILPCLLLVASTAAVPFEPVLPKTTGRVVLGNDVLVYSETVDGATQITVRERRGGGWGGPAVLVRPAAGLVALASSISPDGRRLYFETNARQPAIPGRDDSDVWIVERTASAWAAPRPLGAPFDTPYNEHSPTVDASGRMCLNSARPDGLGENDIYCAEAAGAAPRLVGSISSPSQDAFATLAPNGQVLVFASDRPGGSGGWDLYSTRRTPTGWTPPENLGAAINSEANELNPSMADEGRRLLFVRTSATGRQVLAIPFSQDGR